MGLLFRTKTKSQPSSDEPKGKVPDVISLNVINPFYEKITAFFNAMEPISTDIENKARKLRF